MKIIVISDSHGRVSNIFDAIDKNDDCDEIFFLGDGNSDIKQAIALYKDKKFTCVAGNCDFRTRNAELCEYRRINGKTLYLTHGHMENVKFGVNDLVQKASIVRADVALFGHTHSPFFIKEPKTGIYLLNPGSIGEGYYAILQIHDDGEIDAKHHLI